MVEPKYKRVVLKLSGEALAGKAGFGINPPTIKEVVKELKEVHDLGVEIAIVVGGGKHLARNYWRRSWYGTCSSRLYGNVSHCNERSCTSRCFRKT